VGSPAQAIKLEGCAHDLKAKSGDGRGGWFEGDEADCSVQKTPFPYAVTAGRCPSAIRPTVIAALLIALLLSRHHTLYCLVETNPASSMYRAQAFPARSTLSSLADDPNSGSVWIFPIT
jgi:hypothetical protein